MDGLSVAASVIAVVEISAKVAALCTQYISAVRYAKADIIRLQNVAENLNGIFKELNALLDSPLGPKLEASQRLRQAVLDSSQRLTELEGKLEPGRGRKAMSRFGIRALGWPFMKKDVDKIIQELTHCKENINLAMQIDQTKLISQIDRKINCSTQPKGASIASEPFSIVPFRRDPNFVDRDDILTRIDEKCSHPAGRVALVGIGGVGKSQLAIEYSYKLRETSPQTWVFWVHASNAARFEEAYRNIADTLELPGREKPTTNVLQLVYNWLCSNSSGRWVIILDNSDDWSILYPRQDYGETIASINTQNSGMALARFLPQSQNGSVLITSRNMEVARKLTDGDKDIIKIQPMNENQAIQLLRNKLSDSSNQVTELARLVLALDYIPLAIAQAAGYINQRAPRISVAQYLEELCASENKREGLLAKGTSDLYRDAFASNSVLTAWQISFDYIRQERPSAADLLSFMSFFNQQGIPEFMLRCYADDNGSTSTGDDHDGFEEDLALLRSFLLVTVNTRGDVFEMHQLVQFAIRMWLRSFGNENRWWGKFLSALSKKFPTGNFRNWSKCQVLFPHVGALIEREPEDMVPLRDWSQILAKAASYAMKQGLYSQAEDMARKSIAGWGKVLDKDDSSILESISILASVLWYQGKYEEAEKLNRQVLESREHVLGEKHPDTLESMGNLAVALQRQGKYEEAEKLNRKTLESREHILGESHPDTLTSLNNLAIVLYEQGKYEEAEKLCRQDLKSCENVLGKEHPETLTSVSNLGFVLQAQGKYEEAEKLSRKTLESREHILGESHPDTLTSVNNLAGVLYGQGKYKEAEKLCRQELKSCENVLGKEHPETLTSVSSLGFVLQAQGMYEEAEMLHRRALESSKHVLGEEHPKTLESVDALAKVLQDQGKNEEAEKLYRLSL